MLVVMDEKIEKLLYYFPSIFLVLWLLYPFDVKMQLNKMT